MIGRPAPATIFKDLGLELRDIISRGTRLTEFEKKVWDQRISKLNQVDPTGALELRGDLEAVFGNFAETDSFYARALNRSGFDIDIVLRHMMTLVQTGQSRKVREVFERHRERFKGNPTAIRQAATMLGFSGWVLARREICESMLGSSERVDEAECFAVNWNGLEESAVADAVGESISYLRMRNVDVKGTRSIPVRDERGCGTILFELFAEGEPEALADVEWDLNGHLGSLSLPAIENEVVSVALAINPN